MALLDGKQIRDGSTSLDKLQGHSGLVTFTASATMSFEDGAVLRRETADILVPTDVVNKEYVDAVASGLDPKAPVVVVSNTSVLGLTGVGYAIDGFTISTGERVLVNAQAGVGVPTASNGIYLTNTGTWSRAVDSDGNPITEVSHGNFVFVEEGTLYMHSGWVLTLTDATNPDQILVGTNSQLWVQFSEATDIVAGDGLYYTGQTLNVGAGTGITVSTNNVSLLDTAVTIGSYGSATEVSTFTVDQQGRLTAAGEVLIDITSGQVNNFTASSETAIFTTGNFVDGTTVDFTVTAGDSVTAEVTLGSLTASRFNIINSASASQGWKLGYNTSGQFEWFDPTLSDISEVTAGAGLTGGGASGNVTLDVQTTNGVSIISDSVGLGGTLIQNTTISGDSGSYSLTVGNVDNFLVTASSSFDVSVDNGLIILDAGDAGSVDIYGGDVLIYATGSVDIISTQEFNLQTVDYSLNFTGFGTVSVGGSTAGLVYSATPSNALPLTLIHKQYVDDVVDTLITGVTAGNGLSGGGASGYITLDVNVANGLTIIGDNVQIADTAAGNGLTFSTGVFNVNLGVNSGLTFSGDDIIVDTNIAGNGLDITSGVLSVNTSEISPLLAGAGLTSSGSELDVQVDTSGLNINGSNQVALNTTITGNRTFQDSITINGNLTVLGTSSTIHTENLFVEDNIITLNATYSGPAIPYSGIEVNVGDGTYSTLLWEGSTGYWVAGASGSENYVVTQAGNGLTQSFDTLSVDFASVAESIEGAGLTASGGVINIGQGNGITVNADDIEVNFTQVTDVLAGAGLTGSGVLNVGAGTGITVNADDVAIDFVSITGQGLTQSGGVISVDEPNLDYTTIAGNLDGAGLVVSGSELAVNTGLGITISSDAIIADLEINGGLTFSGNQIEVSVDNSTIQIINGQLVATSQGDIQGVTAGAGLTGGGSSGFITLDVNTGDGIEIVGDAVAVNLVSTDSGLEFVTGELQVDLASNSGLTLTGGLQINSTAAGDGLSFSSGVFDVNVANGLTINGDNVEIDPSIAGTGLSFSGGVLSVVAGSAQPVYQAATSIAQNPPNANDFNTSITITSTPNDYSRVNVYVNGQLQRLGNGVTTTDCYFGTQSGSAVNITDIEAGYTLFWNGVNAGFRLSTTDSIDIIYEA